MDPYGTMGWDEGINTNENGEDARHAAKARRRIHDDDFMLSASKRETAYKCIYGMMDPISCKSCRGNPERLIVNHLVGFPIQVWQVEETVV